MLGTPRSLPPPRDVPNILRGKPRTLFATQSRSTKYRCQAPNLSETERSAPHPDPTPLCLAPDCDREDESGVACSYISSSLPSLLPPSIYSFAMIRRFSPGERKAPKATRKGREGRATDGRRPFPHFVWLRLREREREREAGPLTAVASSPK